MKEKIYKLGEPTDIALDAEGRIYVRDADDKSIKEYGPNGEYLRHVKYRQAGRAERGRGRHDVADETSSAS